MAVEFQCEHCEKTIRAADEQGGSMGTCPHCGHSMYVPLPAAEVSEPLELAEVNPKDEAEERELLEETRQTMRKLLKDRAAGEPKRGADQERTEPSRSRVKPIDPEDAAVTVQEYVVAMARGSLDEAEALAAHLVGNPQVVKPIIARAMAGEFDHPSLREIPPAVQKGFLKKLLEYVK